MHKPNQDTGDPLASLRAIIASRYDDVQEGPMFWCPGFFIGTTMVAGVYDNQIVLRLPENRVTALLETHGCSQFKPYGRAPMRHWLVFGVSSPAYHTLAELVEESVSFAQRTSQSSRRRRNVSKRK
ncbi:TfoX/Sxy family protein [Paraburkholderia aspalathi]|uniref:TfoX N-terminal domain-containing protein n=1 Tax=Paraburkholderia aspalathi TaxID=1324617 RepID=A0A1I7EJG5_9BURK|nr:TfoX N-terminal domain-containing protein [Paraburkholderia aspalathi]